MKIKQVEGKKEKNEVNKVEGKGMKLSRIQNKRICDLNRLIDTEEQE